LECIAKPNILRCKQIPKAIWLTGLSGAGKTTIAFLLKERLDALEMVSVVLDGDELRQTINKNLGYTEADRMENVRRAAEIASLLVSNGIISICSFMSPTEEIRALAKSIIGEDQFIEIFVKATLQDCVQRDVKGLYAQYKTGTIHDMSGVDALYEVPKAPSLIIDTAALSIDESVAILFQFIIGQINTNR
jgi:adenylyl-sulfate kinase